jgi:hypothetical protein
MAQTKMSDNVHDWLVPTIWHYGDPVKLMGQEIWEFEPGWTT